MTLPQLTAALFCEKVLLEQDGVASCVRIIDRIIVSPHEGTTPPGSSGLGGNAFSLNMLISLKGGEFRGETKLTVEMIAPDGKNRQVLSGTAKFGSAGEGANFVIQGPFPIPGPGLYWFEVRCDGQLLTRAPLEILLASASSHSRSSSQQTEPQ